MNAWVQDQFFERVGPFCGGTCSNMVQWAPGRIVSESVDPYHVTSVDTFEEWGRAPIERMYARYDGGVLHLHGNGRHLLEAVTTLKGLKALYLGDDRGFPRAIDALDALHVRRGAVPIVLATDVDTFQRKLRKRELAGGVLYSIMDPLPAERINEAMTEVRAYRAPRRLPHAV